MNLLAMQRIENRRNAKSTVLHRKGGTWPQTEVNRLVHGLRTEASGLPSQPEYLILFGHYTKGQTLEALLGGVAYTATQVTGTDRLPFVPGFF